MKNHPCKLLLFGEYVLMQQSQALALPLDLYKGFWSFEQPAAEHSVAALRELLAFIETNEQFAYLDAPKLRKDLDRRLWFDSNIPNGYGLGSSGAVVAALYESYAKDNFTNLQQLQTRLGALEAHWHGKSSGLDPLVAYLQTPIHIDAKGVQQVTLPSKNRFSVWLLDTQISRKTAPLVEYFIQNAQNADFVQACIEPLKGYNAQAIKGFLEQNGTDFWQAIQQISTLQSQYFERMIPTQYRELWAEGLKTGDFYLKLCGAGGGGFLLVFQKNLQKSLPCEHYCANIL